MKKTIKILICIFLVLAILPFAASASNEYDRAKELLRQKRYSEAAQAFAVLGDEEDAPQLAMYCSAIAAGEQGLYSLAVTNLQSLGDFRDSALLSHYYAALSYEAAEEYETASERFAGYEFYRDVMQRLMSYPEKINARDYRKANGYELAGKLEEALKVFKALGTYQDSVDRAAAVQEKINARDYAAADQAEQDNQLEEALTGFNALGSYQDSKERASAVQEKINARDYAAADAKEQAGDYAGALSGFEALGDYKDSKARADAVRSKGTYAQAMQLAENGKFSEAYKLFDSLGDYEDSKGKAYVLSVSEFAEEMRYLGRSMAAFKVQGVWGLMDLNNNNLSAPYWDSVSSTNEYDLTQVSFNDRYGYIGRDGTEVLPVRFAGVSGFQDGLVTVAIKNGDNYLFGLYDVAGKEVSAAQWRTLGGSENYQWDSRYNHMRILNPRPIENRIKVQNASGKWGFIAPDGSAVGQVKWDAIGDFSEGMAIVQLGDKYGYIGADGLEKIAPQYRDALPFSQGLAAVKTGDRYQFINKENQVVIRPIYTKATSFKNGRAYVFLPEAGWQVINPQGGQEYFIANSTREAYARAEALMAEENYREAYAIYDSLTGFADSNAKMILALEGVYDQGIRKREAGKWDEAVDDFTYLGSFRDAKEQILVTRYAEGEAKREVGDWNGAVEAFEQAGNYSDAAEQILATRYAEGEAKLAAQDWIGAVEAFEQAGNYSDAREQITETYYQQAGSLLEKQEYMAAYEIYKGIVGYKDVDILLNNDESLVKIATVAAQEAKFAVGKYVTFGTYPQTEAGTDSTPVEWLVLARDGKMALLVSRYALDCKPYNTTDVTSVTWEICSLRKWLNDEFVNKAFTASEQQGILTVVLDNSKFQENSKWSTSGGNLTHDKVFLLSYVEAENYFKSDEARKCVPTDYAIKNGAWTSNDINVDGRPTGFWWLRSLGSLPSYAARVNSDGALGFFDYVYNTFIVVRPALWVDLSLEIFQ